MAEWVVALATLAVAITSWQAQRRERQRKEERQEAVDARIGAIAYTLHRQVDSWWDSTWPSGSGHEVKALKKSRWLAEEHFDVAEGRVEAMLAEAPSASSEVARAVRRASVAFYRATRLINEMADVEFRVTKTDEQGDPKRIEVPEEIWKGFRESHGYLIDCKKELEKAIDDRLLRAEDEMER